MSVAALGTARPAWASGLSGGAKSSPQALPTLCGGVATCSITAALEPACLYLYLTGKTRYVCQRRGRAAVKRLPLFYSHSS